MGPSVFFLPLSPILSSSPSPQMRGRSILYVDLVPLHLHPGPWNPGSLLPSIHIHAQSTLHGPLPHPFPRALCWGTSYARGAKNLGALQIAVLPSDTSPAASAPSRHPLPSSSSMTQEHRGALRLSSQGSPASLLSFSNSKLPEEELKDSQLTWGQAVKSMAAITWSLSQRGAGAEEKHRDKCETRHSYQEQYSSSEKI